MSFEATSRKRERRPTHGVCALGSSRTLQVQMSLDGLPWACGGASANDRTLTVRNLPAIGQVIARIGHSLEALIARNSPRQSHTKSSAPTGWQNSGQPLARQYSTNPLLRIKALNRSVLRAAR